MKTNPISVEPRTPDQYQKALGDYLLANEGESLRVHTDPVGIPTLGPGDALATGKKAT
tara:strand:+ start:361 stop:534 length:174 start_codon:yes stop_codon:yes gene_type:complete